MRIVVSTIGTPSYTTSEYLVEIIKPTLNKNKTTLKNSQAFVWMSESFTITEDEVQVSYDVVNLYPSVSAKDATDITMKILSTDSELKKWTKLKFDDIKLLIVLCLSKYYFLWEDKIYLLEHSAPIGLALMVVMAEAYLQFHEKRVIDVGLHWMKRLLLPSNHLCDTLMTVVHGSMMFNQQLHFRPFSTRKILWISNTLWMSQTRNKTLQFLDLNITNNQGANEYKTHCKNAITNVQVKPHSGHDPKTLKGIFTGFLHRACTVFKGQYQDGDWILDIVFHRKRVW